MERIKDFNDLIATLKTQVKKPRVVVPCPNDSHTQQVLRRALEGELIDVILVHSGARNPWSAAVSADFGTRVMQFDTPDEDAASALAVDIVRQGDGDVLMKGCLNTDNLLRAVLDKGFGLLRTGQVLTHLTVASIPSHPNILIFMDAAVIPNPTLTQFEAMLSYGVKVCHVLGISQPNVALINCTEKISDTFPHTRLYEELKREALDGKFGTAVVDGPMDVKTACDKESGDIKGIVSPVAGKADMLMFPDIQAANTFYKTITYFANARIAGILCGTTKPVVVSSRADTAESKFYSLALACGLSMANKATTDTQ